MIIDVHAHYTTAPPELSAYRGRQVGTLNRPSRGKSPNISDDQLAESLQGQLRQMAERKIAALCFSPQASAMGHDFGDAAVSRFWTEVNNDLISRIAEMYPDKFIPVCQLPQSPGVPPEAALAELERCVSTMGFVGCNINPDVSGGLQPFTPSLGDRWWYPLWEKMVELNVPGMIHASSTRNPALHVNGSHYVMQDYAAVVELCASSVFEDFPGLKLIIPHGGGGVPFQFNRHRALHVLQNRRPFEEMVRHLYFDTSLYDEDSMEMLIRKIGADRVIFGSEMFGTAKGVDPVTGRTFDENRSFVDSIDWLNDEDRSNILVGNAFAVFPRAASSFRKALDAAGQPSATSANAPTVS